ncbi:hypothetical protein HXX76_001852 [Chlamydomonas incerta]|uniref:Peptidase S8/S53 domain-containing protein n=1 Tax=Chlamydomonas incerta TaxID=51695 RepID=A0A835TDN0_CHLIN|nr:hypothetical protein HXX76_001852 [Chlamydomonas incerta]|eukprot:KAG2443499.1 hypothetical protein HXX76_001852 [Chlamydomonas incerta]
MLLQQLAVVVAALGCVASLDLAAAATSPNSTSPPYQQQQDQQALLLEEWTLVLRDGVDPVAFAAAMCDAANPLRKLHVYECDQGGVYSVLLRGMSGRFTRAGVRDVQRAYKSSLDHVARAQAFGVGDELVTPEDRRRLGALLLQSAAGRQQPQHPQQLSGDAAAEAQPAGEPGRSAGSDQPHAHQRLLPEQLDPVTWGLDRIDQASLPLDGAYHYDGYGTGVTAYVIDSGVRGSHTQFRPLLPPAQQPASPSAPRAVSASAPSRVLRGYSVFTDATAGSLDGSSSSGSSGGGDNDCYGHGTHVASLLGGVDYGVAKNVTIVPVQVLDCKGNTSEQLLKQGLEWVGRNLALPAVVHMSLEGGYSGAVNAMVDSLAAMGAVVVASAGNSNRDTCAVSPASAQSAVAVAAADADGTRWYRSNWGSCVDLFAPGVNLLAAVPWTDSASGLKTGTSMAAPFVSGVAALYLESHPGATPDDVSQRLLRSAAAGAVADDRYGYDTFTPLPNPRAWDPLDISATPNRLLQSRLAVPLSLQPSVVSIFSTDDFTSSHHHHHHRHRRHLLDDAAAMGTSANANASFGNSNSTPTSSTHISSSPAAAVASLAVSTTAFTASGSSEGGGVDIRLALLLQPSAQVNVTPVVPAGWNGQPLADLFPPRLEFGPADGVGAARALRLAPNPGAPRGGSYHVQLLMRSADLRFDFAVQDIRVDDNRSQVGEDAACPRIIAALPFSDSGNTATGGFRHDYTTSPGNALDTAPDVVYAFTPGAPMAVSVRTCGSGYDTVLLLGQLQPGLPAAQQLQPADTLANDDDPGCVSPGNPAAGSNSRIDTELEAGVTYLMAVSGFNGAAGPFVLSVSCSSCAQAGPGPAGAGTTRR